MSEKTLEELAQIAREWAEKISVREKITFSVDDETLAAARHILATTTPPTMADIAWDDDVHTGLCALYACGDLVLMIGPDLDNKDTIICHYIHYGSPVTVGLLAEKLTPVPGTKINLTPRREPEPESTPDHLTVLTTENDYASAPTGTVVASDFSDPWVKDDLGFWLVCGEGGSEISRLMALSARRVLRWGETL